MLRQVCMHPALQAKGGKLEKVLIGRDVVFPTPLAPWAAFTFCAELDNALKKHTSLCGPLCKTPATRAWCAGVLGVLGSVSRVYWVCWVCWCAGCAGVLGVYVCVCVTKEVATVSDTIHIVVDILYVFVHARQA